MILTLSDGKRRVAGDQPVAEDERSVYYLLDDGVSLARLFREEEPGMPARLAKLLGPFNVAAGDDFWKPYYQWPFAMVTAPRLGVLAPPLPRGALPLRRLASRSHRARLNEEERNWGNCLESAIQLCRAVVRLHQAGLVHGGIGFGSVYADPRTGQVTLVAMEDACVPGLVSSLRLREPDCAAPELCRRYAEPDRDSDLYALAVLLYGLLLHALPKPEPATAEEGVPAAARVLGPEAGALFRQAFGPGKTDPSRRPGAMEWYAAMLRLEDRTAPCPWPGCLGKRFPLVEGEAMRCPWCGKPMAWDAEFPLLRFFRIQEDHSLAPEKDWWMVGLSGKRLQSWHARTDILPGPHASRTPVAEIVRAGGAWRLDNLALEGLRLVEEGRPGRAIPSGTSERLRHETLYLLAPPPVGRAALVQMIPPAGGGIPSVTVSTTLIFTAEGKTVQAAPPPASLLPPLAAPVPLPTAAPPSAPVRATVFVVCPFCGKRNPPPATDDCRGGCGHVGLCREHLQPDEAGVKVCPACRASRARGRLAGAGKRKDAAALEGALASLRMNLPPESYEKDQEVRSARKRLERLARHRPSLPAIAGWALAAGLAAAALFYLAGLLFGPAGQPVETAPPVPAATAPARPVPRAAGPAAANESLEAELHQARHWFVVGEYRKVVERCDAILRKHPGCKEAAALRRRALAALR